MQLSNPGQLFWAWQHSCWSNGNTHVESAATRGISPRFGEFMNQTTVSDITPKVIKTFPDFREVVSQALFHRTCSFTREVGIPALQCSRSPPDTSDPSRASVPGAGLSVS